MNMETLFKVVRRLLRRSGWAPISVVLFHAAVAIGLDAYTRFPPLDIPMHFVGGVAIAYFFSGCFTALPDGFIEPKHRRWAEFVVVAALTTTAAVVWEFAEFLADAFLAAGSQRGLDDTMLDMAMGMLGGVAWLGVAAIIGRLGVPRPLAGD
jgi:hypothetical protein